MNPKGVPESLFHIFAHGSASPYVFKRQPEGIMALSAKHAAELGMEKLNLRNGDIIIVTSPRFPDHIWVYQVHVPEPTRTLVRVTA